MIFFKRILVFILFFMVKFATAGEFEVIANNSFGESNITTSELANIFKGQVSKLNGKKIILVILNPSSPAAKAFFKKIGTTATEFEQAWLETALSGGGTPPRKKATSADVIKEVATTDGAIGFIAGKDKGDASGVRLLTLK